MKRTTFTCIVLMLTATLLPVVVFAAVGTFKDFANVFVEVIKGIIDILFVSLSVGVGYGVALYFLNSDNEKKREQIRGYLLWAVIGLAVTFGMWGLVQILCDTLSWCVAGIPYIKPPA